MDIDSINFLPPRYQHRRAQLRRACGHAALLGLLVACLGGWWLVQQGQTQALRRQVAVYEQQVGAARAQMKLVSELRREHDQLSEQLALWQRLAPPVSHGQVFATLAQQLPAAVVLTHLDVRTQRPVQPSATRAASRARRNMPGQATSGEPTPATDELTLAFTGIAPDDLTLANLLNQLKQHPLFEDVKLHFSRTVNIHGAVGRRFHIQMRVPLDRDYQPTPAGGEVAHAH